MTNAGQFAGQSLLLEYASTLRRRKWTVILVTLLAAAGAFGFSLAQTPVYQATAQVLLEPSASQQVLGSTVNTVPNVNDQISILEGAGVAALVSKELGHTPAVSASSVGGTDIMDVQAQSTSASEAAKVANAYANSYIAYRRTQTINDLLAAGKTIQSRIAAVQQQVSTLEAQSSGAGPSTKALLASQISADEQELTLLTGQLDTVQSSIGLGAAGAVIVNPATPPTSPITPKKLRNTLIGFGGGLILGIGLAAVRETLDDTILGKLDLDRATLGLPVLAEIPEVSRRHNQAAELVSITRPHSGAAEAYRTLRTSVQFIAVDRSLRRIHVTSPRTTEGKTTTIANLAVALAGTGRKVVIVDCDLRRPRIHEMFGLDNTVGFTSVVLGQVPLSEALQAVPGQEGLMLLASGGRSPNPSELLSGQRTVEVLDTLAELFDFVLVDSPPVLPVTDAVVLAPRMDATVVVVSAGTTGAKDLARALEVLGQVDAPVVGLVLNAVPMPGRYGYRYQYRYAPYGRGTPPAPAEGITTGSSRS